jgi:hypothetical protein
MIDEVYYANCIDCQAKIYLGKQQRISKAMTNYALHKCLFYEDTKPRIREIPVKVEPVIIEDVQETVYI